MKIYITMAGTDEIVSVYKKEYGGRYSCLIGFTQDNGEWLPLIEEKAIHPATVAEQVSRIKACVDYDVRYECAKRSK